MADHDIPRTSQDTQRSVLRAIEQRTGQPSKLLLPDEESGHGASPMIDAASDEVTKLPTGRGHYQVLGEIARGGMGVILKSHDTDLGRDVAMKVLLEQHAERPAILQRFVEEAQIGGQLQHPGIVPVYEMGLMEDERPYFTMKLVKGRTLGALFADRESPTAGRRRFITVFEQVCQTMAYAHSRKVIHRDLKPANIMVGAFGEVQVVDWGLAKVIREGGVADERRPERPDVSIIETVRSGSSSEGSHSQVGSVMGTLAYMSPEQAQGETDRLDERTDVFSLGAILCEILCGHPPYLGEQAGLAEEAARAMQDGARQRLAECGADAELIELALRCMTPSRNARPRNAEAVMKEVQRYLASEDERHHQAQVAAAEARVKALQERKNRRLTLALAATVLIAALGGGGWYFQAENQATQQRLRVTQEANTVLEEMQLLRGQGDFDGALVAAERAEAILAAAGDVDPDLVHRIDVVLDAVRTEVASAQAAADLAARKAALVSALQDIQFREDLASPDRDTQRQADEAFTAAFGDYGIDILGDDPESVAEQVRATGHAVEIGLALDEWARIKTRLHGFGAPDAERLGRLASRVDPDPTRTRLREAIAKDDRGTFAALAASPEALLWPPETVAMFHLTLRQLGHASIDREPVLRACVARFPANPAINALYGQYLSNREPPRLQEAIRYFSTARGSRPEWAWPPLRMSQLLADLGEYDAAAAHYVEGLRVGGDQRWVRHWALRQILSRFYAVDATDQVFRVCEAVLARDPENTLALNDLAYNYATHKDPAKRNPRRAVELSRRAVELEPEEGNNWNTLGTALYRAGQTEETITALKKSIELTQGGIFHDWLILALAYEREGRREEARAALRQLAQVELPDPEAANSDLKPFLQEASDLFGIQLGF